MGQKFLIVRRKPDGSSERFDPEGALGDGGKSSWRRDGSLTMRFLESRWLKHWDPADLVYASGDEGSTIHISGPKEAFDTLFLENGRPRRCDWVARLGLPVPAPADYPAPGEDDWHGRWRREEAAMDPKEGFNRVLDGHAWREDNEAARRALAVDLSEIRPYASETPLAREHRIDAIFKVFKSARAETEAEPESVSITQAIRLCRENGWRYEPDPPALLVGGNVYDFGDVDIDRLRAAGPDAGEQIFAQGHTLSGLPSLDGAIFKEDSGWSLRLSPFHPTKEPFKMEGAHLKPLWEAMRREVQEWGLADAVSKGRDLIDPATRVRIEDGGGFLTFAKALASEAKGPTGAIPFAEPAPGADRRVLDAFLAHAPHLFVAGQDGRPAGIAITAAFAPDGRPYFSGRTAEAFKTIVSEGLERAKERTKAASKGSDGRGSRDA